MKNFIEAHKQDLYKTLEEFFAVEHAFVLHEQVG